MRGELTCLVQLTLSTSELDFPAQAVPQASKRLRSLYDVHPNSNAGPEACYWAGVAACKTRHDAKDLAATAQALGDWYPRSE